MKNIYGLVAFVVTYLVVMFIGTRLFNLHPTLGEMLLVGFAVILAQLAENMTQEGDV